MATTMTWVHIPTKNVTLTIPNHTVNRQAIREFANTVEEVENFIQNLSQISPMELLSLKMVLIFCMIKCMNFTMR